jgi:hypothetical protein
MNPTSCLGKWLKDHPRASQAHRVLRYDRDLLVTYCGRTIPAAEAVAPVQSVAWCPDCTDLWRKQTAGKARPNAALRLVTPPRNGAK